MINAWECVTSIDQCRNLPIANHAIGGKVTHEHVEIFVVKVINHVIYQENHRSGRRPHVLATAARLLSS